MDDNFASEDLLPLTGYFHWGSLDASASASLEGEVSGAFRGSMIGKIVSEIEATRAVQGRGDMGFISFVG